MAGVKSTHPDYDKFAPKWKRTRDVIEGQDAIHSAGVAYLPKLKDEEQDDYAARVKRSDFFNGTWRVIDAFSGMAFRKPPTVDVPTGIESYLDDITLSGVPMETFAKETVEEVLGTGRIGILVDHAPQPESVTALTVEAAQRLGLRPTLQLYTAESIRNWKFTSVNNAWVLSMVVLGECAMVQEDEFTEKEEQRYRVLDLDGGTYRQRVFKTDDSGKDILLSETVPLMNGKPLEFIPFYITGANGRGDEIDEPPLIDLVDKNIAHYQVSADYRHGLHFAGLPTLFLAGMDPPSETGGRYYIGSSAAIIATHPDAKASFIEFTGQGLGAIEKALDRIELQMAMLGARVIADETKQVETLGATQIKRAGENGVLSKIVQAVSETLENALELFAEWAGQPATEIVYQINRDFLPALLDGRELVGIVQAFTSGALSEREMFDLFQRADVIDPEKSFEAHQEEIKANPPVPKPAPAAPPTQAAA